MNLKCFVMTKIPINKTKNTKIALGKKFSIFKRIQKVHLKK
jgi:hypothetical protein